MSNLAAVRVFRAGSLALLLAAAACAAPATEPSGSTESNATQVPGSSITGSAFVDPAKTYLNRRHVKNLYAGSNLDRAAMQVVERVAGVIANDGFVSTDELVAMEQPPHASVLFPEEKALLPRIWEAMVVGSVAPAVQLAGAAGDTLLKDRITTQVSSPTPVVVTKVPIANLKYDLRDVAKRIQLGHDDDADPTTISPADVALARTNPAFTSAEVALMAQILEAQRARGTSTASAKLVLPYDGVKDERYGAAGRFEIVRSRRLVLEETRQVGSHGGEISVELAAEETIDDRLLFDGTEAIVALFSTTSADEYLVGPIAGDPITRVPAGKYLAQVWQQRGIGPFAGEGGPCATDGQVYERTCGRCGHAQAVCAAGKVTAYGPCTGESPACTTYQSPPKTLAGWFEIELTRNHPPAAGSESQRTVRLTPFVDYDVVTTSGAPVAKWLGYATSGGKAQWTFGPFDPGHLGDDVMPIEQMAAIVTPKVSLPVGAYKLDEILATGHRLDIHPNGVVFLTLPTGATRRLLPAGAGLFKTAPLPNQPNVSLAAKSGEVTSSSQYGGGYPRTTTLKASARD